MLSCEVVKLGTVDVGVVELPLILVEVAPAADRRVRGYGLPPVVPDPPRAEHREELRPPGTRRGQVRRSCKLMLSAVEVALGEALDRVRSLDPPTCSLTVGVRSTAWWY